MSFLNDTIDTVQLENSITFSEMTRLRALSTTNFGMATPFLSRQREQAASDLMNNLDGYSQQIEEIIENSLQNYLTDHNITFDEENKLKQLDSILIFHSDSISEAGKNHFLTVSTPEGYKQGMPLTLVSSDGKVFPAINLGTNKDKNGVSKLNLYVKNQQAFTDGIYQLCALTETNSLTTTTNNELNANSANISND